jgi:signal peptidase I
VADQNDSSGPDASARDGGSKRAHPPLHRARPKRPPWLGWVREVGAIAVIALVATALLRAFVVQAFFVPSGSMMPTIHLRDRILVSRVSHLARGEVVVFEDPGGWLSPAEQPRKPGPVRHLFEWSGVLPNSGHGYLVKRIIGLPGDHVVCCRTGGRLSINSKQIAEPYLNTGRGPADDVTFDVVVPDHRIFVLGDNRYQSGDSSRHFDPSSPNAAFVPKILVTGRAIAVIWPWKDRQVLHIPRAFAHIPAGGTPPTLGTVATSAPGDEGPGD